MEKFNFIFSGDTRNDALSLCHYIDSFYADQGVSSVDIDIGKLMTVVSGMVKDFPSPYPIGDSSPFKKAASFTAHFAVIRPILTPLPAAFADLQTHQNSILALELSLDALHGAELVKDGVVVKLENRIKMSDHFWKDLVASISNCIPVHHFNCLSLLYESLSYAENPSASYPRQ